MNNVLKTLSAYFDANSPDSRAKALTALIAAYRQAQAAPEPKTVSLPPSDLAEFRRLAKKVNLDSAEELLEYIAATPPLLKQIGDFLSTPAVEPAAGLPEIIIRPEEPVSRGIARIGIQADCVTVLLPGKRTDFKQVVKSLDYHWNGKEWQKNVSGWEKAVNAAAELAHRLLAAGFWVAPPTPEVRDLIIEESFVAEIRRKVMVRTGGQYNGWFVLWWRRSEDCWDAARRITVNWYDKPVVVVPPEYYDEVEDFAGQHDFFITPAAQRAIARARTALESAMLVRVEIDEPEVKPAPANDKPPKLTMPVAVDIDDDLRDKD